MSAKTPKKTLTEKPTADAWQTKAENYLASWQRAQADFENYRKRMEAAHQNLIKLAAADALLAVTPILDDFRRAFQTIPKEQASSAWVAGIRQVEQHLRNRLAGAGFKPIEDGGQFDPARHEAIASEPHPTAPEGTIIEVVELGWRMDERVIKPARVRVSAGPRKKVAEG